MKERVLRFFQKALALIQGKKFKLSDEWISFIIQGMFFCFLAFIFGSVASSLLVPIFVHPFLQVDVASKKHAVHSFSFNEKTNYLSMKKSIIHRNLFNRTGELPKEEDEKEVSKAGKPFDDATPCTPTKIKATLLGTVFSDTGKSYAVVQEIGYEFSDIYSVGDMIIGSEASIVRVERNQLILNNAGRKECLHAKGFDALAKSQSAGGGTAGSAAPIVLGSKWVTGELGEGFSKIMQSAHVVPNAEGEKVKGYKIFGIESGTLFDRVGLKDGDIVIQVNRIVMDAEHGFSLYQAFLESRDIAIDVLRQGKDPATIHVKIE